MISSVTTSVIRGSYVPWTFNACSYVSRICILTYSVFQVKLLLSLSPNLLPDASLHIHMYINIYIHILYMYRPFGCVAHVIFGQSRPTSLNLT